MTCVTSDSSLINCFIAESVSFKVDKSGNGGSGSSGNGGSGNRDLGPEYRMPPRLEMLLDMPPVLMEEQVKHAWNTEDRLEYNLYNIMHIEYNAYTGRPMCSRTGFC